MQDNPRHGEGASQTECCGQFSFNLLSIWFQFILKNISKKRYTVCKKIRFDMDECSGEFAIKTRVFDSLKAIDI